MGEAARPRRPEREARRQQRKAQRLSQVQGTEFDNLRYWEHRYTTDLERGSGVGSRGEHLEFKRALLEATIAQWAPRSILDVGCGDLEVLRTLNFAGTYTGIDLSPSIVARNAEIRPDWQFIAGDFLALSAQQPMRADLVLCFDVLIHQHDPLVYRAMVQALLDAADQLLLVNGFDDLGFWEGKALPVICAFHEPLIETLRTLGVAAPEPVGSFRSTMIYRVTRA